jgi:hypothetical protein
MEVELMWSRRRFLEITGKGAAALGVVKASQVCAQAPAPSAMPGPFPGRVVGIYHSNCYAANAYQTAAVQQMVRSGLCELTGSPNYLMAWRRFVRPGDVVGIKVNPNGHPQLPQLISSKALLMEVISGLLLAGVMPKDIVVFERYQDAMNYVKPWVPSWVRLMVAAVRYDAIQQSLGSTYDPNYYVDYPNVLPGQSLSSDAARRSYFVKFLTTTVNKVVNLTVLKTHQAAGVTLALKNLSHGLANNAVRSHPAFPDNRINQHIPAIVSHPIVRSKAVLHIVDGIHGLFHGGPFGAAQFTWQNNTMYFATDPVALDRVGWREIDAKRLAMGRPVLAQTPADPPYFNYEELQPQHIEICGALGLGEWRDDRITYVRKVIG